MVSRLLHILDTLLTIALLDTICFHIIQQVALQQPQHPLLMVTLKDNNLNHILKQAAMVRPLLYTLILLYFINELFELSPTIFLRFEIDQRILYKSDRLASEMKRQRNKRKDLLNTVHIRAEQ